MFSNLTAFAFSRTLVHPAFHFMDSRLVLTRPRFFILASLGGRMEYRTSPADMHTEWDTLLISLNMGTGNVLYG